MRVLIIGLVFAISILESAYADEAPDYSFMLSLGDTEYPWNSNPGLEEQGDDKVTSWAIGGGIKIAKNIFINLSYNHLGKHKKDARVASPPYNSGPFAEIDTDTSTIALSLSPQLKVSKHISLVGEIGQHWWEQEVATTSVIYQGGIFSSFSTQNIKADGNDTFWSLGAKYEINSKYHLGLKYSDYKILSVNLKNYSIFFSYDY